MGGGSFEGSWSGTASGNGVNGAMSLTIDQNNNVTGSDTISKPGFTCTDSGSISSSGNMTLVSSYGGTTVANISAAMVSTGTALTSTSGTISVVGGSSTNVILDLSASTVLLKHQ